MDLAIFINIAAFLTVNVYPDCAGYTNKQVKNGLQRARAAGGDCLGDR